MRNLNNIGEGIYTLGVMIAVGMTKNYWLLILMILPALTWLTTNEKIQNKNNNYIFEEHELTIEKLKEELRILKERSQKRGKTK